MPAWDMISPPEENLSYVPAFRAMCVRSNHWQLYTEVLVGVGVKSAGVTGATRQPKAHELTDSDSKLARPRPRYCIFLQACTPSPFFDATQQCTWSKVLSWSALPLCRHPFFDSASFPQSFLAMSGWRRPGAPFGSCFWRRVAGFGTKECGSSPYPDRAKGGCRRCGGSSQPRKLELWRRPWCFAPSSFTRSDARAFFMLLAFVFCIHDDPCTCIVVQRVRASVFTVTGGCAAYSLH